MILGRVVLRWWFISLLFLFLCPIPAHVIAGEASIDHSNRSSQFTQNFVLQTTSNSSHERVLSTVPQITLDHEPGDELPPVTMDMIVVFLIISAALISFSLELVPMDITALLVMISLILLEPWTGISAQEGISGFSSPATLTVLALFIISEGIRRTGVIQNLGSKFVEWTGGSLKKQLAVLISFVCPTSGFMNNTAVVAILYPMISDMAHRSNNSPSKLLIPLSYASMFGGMLTVIGTSTNLLASDLSYRLLGRPIGMFEFTHLGVLISLAGGIFLMTVGLWMLPERIKPNSDLTQRFEMQNYLTGLTVRPNSQFINQRVRDVFSETDLDVDVVQIHRRGETLIERIPQQTIQNGDQLILRSDQQTLLNLSRWEGLGPPVTEDIDVDELEKADTEQNVIEVVVSPESELIGETLESINFQERFDSVVLAMRHAGKIAHSRFEKTPLNVGDVLLIQAPSHSIPRLKRNKNFIVAESPQLDFRTDRTIPALIITTAVIGLAAMDVFSILAAALAGCAAMVLTGCLKSREIYDAVHWDVIFLIAGVIPMGIAMEKSGIADLMAGGLVHLYQFMPAFGVLAVLYFVTALLTNILSNNASVLVMLPVAIDTALRLDSNPFSFVIAVTFAASTAFMTPMGYQTNLFVYGPGGYEFTDFVKVGGLLQLFLGLITIVGIAFFWPL